MLIAAGILAFLAILLACPVTVSASFEEELSLRIRYLFFRFTVLPAKEKPEPERKKKAEKKKPAETSGEEKKPDLREILKKKGVDGLLTILREAAALAVSVLKKFLSHVKVLQFDLDVAVATEDAAETALWYGRVCAVVYPAVSALMQACGCRRFGVSVFPDFDRKEARARLTLRARIELFFLLKESLSALLRAAKLWMKFRDPQPDAPAQAGAPGTK